MSEQSSTPEPSGSANLGEIESEIQTAMATVELPITLQDLAPKTREWILAKAWRLNLSPQIVLVEVLDRLAKKELKPV